MADYEGLRERVYAVRRATVAVQPVMITAGSGEIKLSGGFSGRGTQSNNKTDHNDLTMAASRVGPRSAMPMNSSPAPATESVHRDETEAPYSN